MHAVGKSHSAGNAKDYNHRIEAINYTLSHDDGVTHRGLEEADLVLVGVSRSGKTPTSLYMAMQFGIKAANYPLIPEDLEANRLPPSLIPLKHKVWGLTIQPERLHQIRKERRPDSKYADLDELPLRGGGRREAHAPGRHPVPRLHDQVHRGDRHDHAARGAARAPGLLSGDRTLRGGPPPGGPRASPP